MYHAVETEPRPPKYKHFYVTAREFAWQMRRLGQLGYQPVDVGDLHESLASNRPLPGKPIVLTFDDGYANLLTNVDPILSARKWPYTVFLVSDLVGRRNEWVASEGYDPTPLLCWGQIDEMRRNGCARFQPHTATHANLGQLSSERIRDEVTRARQALEDRLQEPMETLCYPYGGYTDAVVRIAQDAGYRRAVTTDFGRVRQGDDPMRLPRVSIYHVPPVSLTYGIGTLNFDWRLQTRTDNRPAREPVAV
jgi:peptidoglycan/xylan/chitin deacetylase (PgdA/CDA1 family)